MIQGIKINGVSIPNTTVSAFTYDNINTLTISNTDGTSYPVTIDTLIVDSISATTYSGISQTIGLGEIAFGNQYTGIITSNSNFSYDGTNAAIGSSAPTNDAKLFLESNSNIPLLIKNGGGSNSFEIRDSSNTAQIYIDYTNQLAFNAGAYGPIYFGSFYNPSAGLAGFSKPGEVFMAVSAQHSRMGVGGGGAYFAANNPAALLEVKGKANEVQLKVTAFNGQTNDIVQVTDESGLIFSIDDLAQTKLHRVYADGTNNGTTKLVGIDSVGKLFSTDGSTIIPQYWTAGTAGNYSIRVKNGGSTDATGDYAVAEGFNTTASGIYSHAGGVSTLASSNFTFAYGFGSQSTAVGAVSFGQSAIASGTHSLSVGQNTSATGNWSQAFGYYTLASNEKAHAEGVLTTASGVASHAEGSGSKATAESSHAEGHATNATSFAAHSEGYLTTASGQMSHAGGWSSKAIGDNSFVHGYQSQANSNGTIVLGNNLTGTSSNTVYINNLNIKSVSGGTAIAGLAIDVNGNVITGSTGSGTDIYVTGGTYNPVNGTTTLLRNDNGTVIISGYSTATSGNYLPLSGGTVSGATVFTDGFTANTVYSNRLAPSVLRIDSSATPALNTDIYTVLEITGLTTNITSFTTSLSGTPVDFQRLIIRVKDNGVARTITWGASFVSLGATLPLTTTISKTLTIGFLYSTLTGKWGCVAAVQEV